MISKILLASLLTCTAAFAPSQQCKVSVSSLRETAAEDAEAVDTYVKSVALPFLEAPPNLKGYAGDVGFDPFRFSDFLPVDFLREAELKHGRICMLAVVGFAAVDCGFRIYPLPEAYEGLTSITAHDALVKQGAMPQLFLWIGIMETLSTIAVIEMLNGSGREAGDFGFDPLGFIRDKSEDEVTRMKVRELKNGRLAMIAFGGMVTGAVLSQHSFPYTY